MQSPDGERPAWWTCRRCGWFAHSVTAKPRRAGEPPRPVRRPEPGLESRVPLSRWREWLVRGGSALSR